MGDIVYNTLSHCKYNDKFVYLLLTQIATYSSSRIDCSNPTDFVTLLVALGLNPHIDQIDCYLDSTTNTALVTMRNQLWVNKTIVGDYEQYRCPLCTSINLRNCCA